MPRYSDRELLSEIVRLASELGHPPSAKEMREQGKFSSTVYADRFGSWKQAVEKAGYTPHEQVSKIPNQDLIDELQRLAEELGEPPTLSAMDEKGEYRPSTYKTRFGSWADALEAAGLDSTRARTGEEKVPEQVLLENLRELADEPGDAPTFQDMLEDGPHSPTTYVRRFGSWSEAIESAGLEPRDNPSPTPEDLLTEIRRLAEELGKQPTTRDMEESGKHSPNTYYTYFDSWSAAVDEALENRDEE